MILHFKYKSLYWDERTSKWTFLLKKQLGHKEQCAVKRCTNFRRITYEGNKRTLRLVCHKCHSRVNRANNPIRYMFKELKHSAKRRNIPFELSYQDFVLFCNENDYTSRQYSIKSDMTTVDRINDNLGYTYSNIQMLTNGQNVAKGNIERHKYDTEEDPF